MCRKHVALLGNQDQRTRWERARSHSVESISWFQDKVKSEQVEGHIFWPTKCSNPTTRRHIGYFINDYWF